MLLQLRKKEPTTEIRFNLHLHLNEFPTFYIMFKILAGLSEIDCDFKQNYKKKRKQKKLFFFPFKIIKNSTEKYSIIR